MKSPRLQRFNESPQELQQKARVFICIMCFLRYWDQSAGFSLIPSPGFAESDSLNWPVIFGNSEVYAEQRVVEEG